MSLRAKFLRLLHRLLRVPPPAPVVQRYTPGIVMMWYYCPLPLPDAESFRAIPEDTGEFHINIRPNQTIQ